MTTCCHCEKPIQIPDALEGNVRNYGGNSFNVRCSNKKCNRIVRVSARRTVQIDSVTCPASDQSYESF